MGERPAPRPGIDPEFTDEDVEEILDELEHEDSLCGGCRQPKAESFDPKNEDAYDGVTVACHACAARERAVERLDDRHGVFSYATKRPGRR